MIQNKQTLVARISSRGNLRGSLNQAIVKEYPELESIEVTPSREQQVFKSEKYGYETVTVKAVESESLNIVPSAEEQSYSGMYSNVIVVGEPNLKPEIIKKDEIVFGVKGTAELKGEENAIIKTSGYTPNTGSSDPAILKSIIVKIPQLDTSGWTTTAYMFSDCKELTEIPQLDTSSVKKMDYMFRDCKKITKIPQLNTSNVTDMDYMFSGCSNLTEIPQLDTGKVADMQSTFRGCGALTKIPQLSTSNVARMDYTFHGCGNLTEIPQLDTSNVTRMEYAFYSCGALTKIPQLDTSNVTNIGSMFAYCKALTEVPQLNASKITSLSSAFNYCYEIVDFGGLKDLGKAYITTSPNYSACTISVAYSSKLTHESLMNLINNLYDLNLTYNVANGGTLKTQSLNLGNTNKAKLTAEEIAIATNKGWTVS